MRTRRSRNGRVVLCASPTAPATTTSIALRSPAASCDQEEERREQQSKCWPQVRGRRVDRGHSRRLQAPEKDPSPVRIFGHVLLLTCCWCRNPDGSLYISPKKTPQPKTASDIIADALKRKFAKSGEGRQSIAPNGSPSRKSLAVINADDSWAA